MLECEHDTGWCNQYLLRDMYCQDCPKVWDEKQEDEEDG